jgi:glucose/arabinose dehydrogenase
MHSHSARRAARAATVLGAGLYAFLAGCSDQQRLPTSVATGPASGDRDPNKLQCSPDNAHLTLPPGFCAVVVADLTENGAPAAARHLAITPDGDIFVAVNAPGNRQPAFGIIGLRDRDGDGVADEQSAFSPGLGGSGLAYKDGLLYFGANDRVLRYRISAGRLSPEHDPEVVVSGLPATGDHISKDLALGDGNRLFVNIGSASNSCQVQNRVLESPGVFPCPELPIRAGLWLFDAGGSNQSEANGVQYATGYRNLVSITVNPGTGDAYAVQQGRDMLHDNWPDLFTEEQQAVLPAEEMVRIGRGSNNGWPYCYFDAVFEHKKVLAPEYGGDGHIVRGTQGIDCSTFNQPLASFGAHTSPETMLFYTGDQFPAHYRGGAFVAFHGGFNRAPLPNAGFDVEFVPFAGSGTPSGPAEVFADGFAESTGPLPATAKHRPVGLAQGHDGSLYVSDDRGGRIYRIIFRGGNDR